MQRELRDMVYEYALDLHTDLVLYSVYDDRYTHCNVCDEWFIGALSTKVKIAASKLSSSSTSKRHLKSLL
jgi:hypothetical protein